MLVARRAPPGNLPAEQTTFVGRRRESDQVRRLLAAGRLVTVTGIGGVGKTRLTLRVAALVRRAFPDGVWFVDLTELRDHEPFPREDENAEFVARRVAATLGLQDRSGLSQAQQLIDYVGDRQLLLLLDNCEHVVQACAFLAGRLLPACPGMRILASSRDRLGVTGEVVFSVPPLPTLEPNRRRATLSRCESVALFTVRAQAAAPGFELTGDNHAAVAALCHRLDGLPLAIELAAARASMLTPEQILARLADRFAVLGHGGHGVPARQQTLRACVDWSYALCGRPERLLWARLSVFVGGFELDAVEGICADAEVPADAVLDLVGDLVDKSVLVRLTDGRDDSARYRMLETIRDYGQEQLRQTGEQQALRRRHRDWYQRLVVRAKREWISPLQEYWMARLASEHANLRAAVDYCLAEPGEAAAALDIAVTLPGLYWWTGGLLGEGRRWLDRGLAQVTEPTPLLARAQVLDGQITLTLGLTEDGMRLLDQGEQLAGRLGATFEVALAAYTRGLSAMYRRNLPAALEHLERSRSILATLPESGSGLELELRLGQLNALGVAAALAGDQQRADACAHELLAITEPREESRFRLYALWALALSAWRQGDVDKATAPLIASLSLPHLRKTADPYGVARCVETAAWIAAYRRQHRRAATLLGAAATQWTLAALPIATQQHLIGDHERCERQARAALGDKSYTEAFTRGQALTYDDAIAYARHDRRATASAPATEATALTRRERQVAELVARGRSNREIAHALVISQRTAESHVEHILAKLGVASRVEVAVWVAGGRAGGPDDQ
jgi:predicted ATPase/DNA-binding CsgD family transcriptional regulator